MNKYLESKHDTYKPVFICFKLSPKANELLTKAANRCGRKKLKEASLRLEDHLQRFYSIIEVGSIQKEA